MQKSRQPRRPFSSRTRIVVALGVAAAATTALVACSSSSKPGSGGGTTTSGSSSAGATQSGKTVSIGFIGFGDAVTFTQAVYKAMQTQAGTSGASVTLIDGGLDPKKQANAMQDAITSGKYSALVVEPNDAVSLAVQVRAAAKAHINVIALDYTFGPLDQQGQLKQLMPEVESTIGLGRDLVTQTFVTNIEAACTAKVGAGKPCAVALQPLSRAVAFSNETSGSIKTALDKTGYIHADFAPDGAGTSTGGYQSMVTYLQGHKGVDVVWSEGDVQTIGIQRAIQQAGLTPGKDILLNSYSGTKEAVTNIKAGLWFSSLPIYPAEGAKAVQDAVALAHGGKVAPTTDEYSLPGTLPNLTPSVLQQNPSFDSTWSATTG